MIIGSVNVDFEPIIPLSICGFDGKAYTQDAIIDTGFNGWLSLPPDLIARLDLKWKKRSVQSVAIGCDQTSIYVVMSRTFQSGQLLPWLNLTAEAQALPLDQALHWERKLWY